MLLFVSCAALNLAAAQSETESDPADLEESAAKPFELLRKAPTVTGTDDSNSMSTTAPDELSSGQDSSGESEPEGHSAEGEEDEFSAQDEDGDEDGETIEIEPSEFAQADDDRVYDDEHEYPNEDQMRVFDGE